MTPSELRLSMRTGSAETPSSTGASHRSETGVAVAGAGVPATGAVASREAGLLGGAVKSGAVLPSGYG